MLFFAVFALALDFPFLFAVDLAADFFADLRTDFPFLAGLALADLRLAGERLLRVLVMAAFPS